MRLRRVDDRLVRTSDHDEDTEYKETRRDDTATVKLSLFRDFQVHQRRKHKGDEDANTRTHKGPHEHDARNRARSHGG